MCIKPGPGHPGKDAQAWFVCAHAQVLLTGDLFLSPTAMSDVMVNEVEPFLELALVDQALFELTEIHLPLPLS